MHRELRMVLIAKTGSMSETPIEFKSDRPYSHELQVNELKAKIASLEKEKEEAHKQGEQDQITKSNREAIEAMIPRNLPQYRSDEDFQKEVELRVGQINEYTSLDDMRDLYDAKLWKYAKQLSGKTASVERQQFFDFIHNALSDITGRTIVHRQSGSNNRITNYNNRIPEYEPIASKQNNSKSKTASSVNDNSLWFLDLFSQQY